MEVHLSTEGMEEALKRVDPRIIERSVVSTLNKMAPQTVNFITKRITSEYNIKSPRVKKWLRIYNRASLFDWIITITGKTRGLALSYFGAKQAGKRMDGKSLVKAKRVRGAKGGGVSVQVKKAGGRKTVRAVDGNKPFMVQFKSGHVAVVIRPKGQSKLKQLFGPGVAGLMQTAKISKDTESFINQAFRRIFKNQIEWRKGQ
jgi:hypothetical protein